MREQLVSITLLSCLPLAAFGKVETILPVRHGIFVENQTACIDAHNSAILSFRGDRLNGAHFEGRILEVSEADGVFVVVLDLQGNAGMGGGQSGIVNWRISAPTDERMEIAGDFGAAGYRWCAASIDELGASKVDGGIHRLQPQTEAAAPFMGTWGYVGDGVVSCEPHATKTFSSEHAETAYSRARYTRDDYREFSPGHWRVDATGEYEGREFNLQIDLYLDGDSMREVVTTEDGRRVEYRWGRCTG